MSYRDDQGRTWHFNAIECKETVDGETTTFAWITDLKVDARKVDDVATKGGRHRWHIENQGFNRQKNSGLNLEHVFSTDPERLKAYYYLLQIAHIILQILEVGSLLRNVAAEFGRTPGQLFGSLKNLARRLLEAFRYIALSDKAFDSSPTPAAFKFGSILPSPSSSVSRVTRCQPPSRELDWTIARRCLRARTRRACLLPGSTSPAHKTPALCIPHGCVVPAAVASWASQRGTGLGDARPFAGAASAA